MTLYYKDSNPIIILFSKKYSSIEEFIIKG